MFSSIELKLMFTNRKQFDFKTYKSQFWIQFKRLEAGKIPQSLSCQHKQNFGIFSL